MGCAQSKPKPVEEEGWLLLPPPGFPPEDSARARRAYALQQEVGLYGCEFREIKHHLRARGRWGAMVREGRFAEVKRAWEGLKRGGARGGGPARALAAEAAAGRGRRAGHRGPRRAGGGGGARAAADAGGGGEEGGGGGCCSFLDFLGASRWMTSGSRFERTMVWVTTCNHCNTLRPFNDYGLYGIALCI